MMCGLPDGAVEVTTYDHAVPLRNLSNVLAEVPPDTIPMLAILTIIKLRTPDVLVHIIDVSAVVIMLNSDMLYSALKDSLG